MIITTLSSLVLAGLQSGLACPIMGGPANLKLAPSDYQGVRYSYCCEGCKETFDKDPKKGISKIAKMPSPAGYSLFDPVSGTRTKLGTVYADFKGVRYPFASAENKAAFEKEPARYATAPEKEAYTCVVQKTPIEATAFAYQDVDGVRYYFCCQGCQGAFKANPAKFVTDGKAFVKKATAHNVKAEKS